jgi:hypothetical protein
MKGIYVPLPPDVLEALRQRAARELRDPRHEAALLIRQGLAQNDAAGRGHPADVGERER